MPSRLPTRSAWLPSTDAMNRSVVPVRIDTFAVSSRASTRSCRGCRAALRMRATSEVERAESSSTGPAR